MSNRQQLCVGFPEDSCAARNDHSVQYCQEVYITAWVKLLNCCGGWIFPPSNWKRNSILISVEWFLKRNALFSDHLLPDDWFVEFYQATWVVRPLNIWPSESESQRSDGYHRDCWRCNNLTRGPKLWLFVSLREEAVIDFRRTQYYASV